MIRYSRFNGSFYPGDQALLDKMISNFLQNSKDFNINFLPRLLLVPHAGYIYSGQTAVNGYKLFKKNTKIKKLILVGPAHYVGFNSIAVPESNYFQTPFGNISIDQNLKKTLFEKGGSQITYNEAAHIPEHNLEVQLPFIYKILGIKSVLPLLTGINPDIYKISSIFLQILKENVDLGIIFSSDLSHFHNLKEAENIDKTTINNIVNRKINEINDTSACGFHGIKIMLLIVQQMGFDHLVLDYTNSGNVSKDYSKVVGYVSMIFG